MKLKIQKSNFKFIYLEITNKCNLNCPFCPSTINNGDRVLDLNKIESYLKEISKYTNTVYLHILGEPLLHPNFEEIIKLCDVYNLKVRLTTNGSLVDKYDFTKLNINKISFSLQSLIQYDDNELIKYFNKLKIMIDSIKDKLKSREIGIDFRVWNDKESIKVIELNKKINKYLSEIIKINELINVRISEDNEFEWPNEENTINDHKMKCLGGITQLGVLSNGDVVLCCLDYNGKTKLGNLNNETLEQILSNVDYQNAMIKMQGGKPYFKLCESCKFRNKFN